MVKVKCKICGEEGYTAAPKVLKCECGGSFRVIREKREDRITTVDRSILDLFNFSNLINYGNN
ncbi:MAG: hypothetical protein C4533_05145 [Candidatus Omnitrophota bacterium]|jgi:hypothetical protein|nr:MAG: hypothetical protein C4533_05145 [Candidatus Omnitrophota bacterium]